MELAIQGNFAALLLCIFHILQCSSHVYIFYITSSALFSTFIHSNLSNASRGPSLASSIILKRA